jgi:hypothetical protein
MTLEMFSKFRMLDGVALERSGLQYGWRMNRYGGVVGLLPQEAICSVESVKGSGERSFLRLCSLGYSDRGLHREGRVDGNGID